MLFTCVLRRTQRKAHTSSNFTFTNRFSFVFIGIGDSRQTSKLFFERFRSERKIKAVWSETCSERFKNKVDNGIFFVKVSRKVLPSELKYFFLLR